MPSTRPTVLCWFKRLVIDLPTMVTMVRKIMTAARVQHMPVVSSASILQV